MENLFHMYWWLLFPLGFALFMVWNSFLQYRRQKAAIDLIKIYAQSGKEPPAELLTAVTRSEDLDEAIREAGQEKAETGWGYFLLFGALAGGFALLQRFNPYGLAEAFLIAAVISGSLAVAFLVWALFRRPRKGD